MTLDFFNIGLSLRAALMGAIVGSILLVLAVFVPPPGDIDAVTLSHIAMIFSGVHFTSRAGVKLLPSIIGGMLSAFFASIVLVLVSLILPGEQSIFLLMVIGTASGGIGAAAMMGIQKVS